MNPVSLINFKLIKVIHSPTYTLSPIDLAKINISSPSADNYTHLKGTVKDVRRDPELGGQNMELRLVEYFADEFNKQIGNGVDVRKSPKSMEKLKKQVFMAAFYKRKTVSPSNPQLLHGVHSKVPNSNGIISYDVGQPPRTRRFSEDNFKVEEPKSAEPEH